jgi:hypothetical protein
MSDQSEDEERQAVLDKLQRRIDQLHELQRVADHLRSGGSYDDPWVAEFLAREDEDE